jgi:hypothetical protein
LLKNIIREWRIIVLKQFRRKLHKKELQKRKASTSNRKEKRKLSKEIKPYGLPQVSEM